VDAHSVAQTSSQDIGWATRRPQKEGKLYFVKDISILPIFGTASAEIVLEVVVYRTSSWDI
jgi:hypothetical protein